MVRIVGIGLVIALAAWGALALLGGLQPVEPSHAARLIVLPPPPGDYDCAWLERRIEGIKSVHFLWHGCEDGGGGEEFRRIDDQGRGDTIVGIQSVMIGDNGIGQARYAKTLPLEDPSDDPKLWVTFDGVMASAGDDCYPVWQRRIPVILFGLNGDRSDWSSLELKFRLMRLSKIVEQSKVVPPGEKPTLGRCDASCCHSIVPMLPID